MSTTTERTDWLAERNRVPGVGASEAAALFGLHPNISAFSLFEKLVNPKPPTDEELEEENDVQSFGHAIEPYLADWYARKTGRYVAPPAFPVYRAQSRDYIFASPDRVYDAVPGEGEMAVLELKSALYFKPEDPLPDYWQVQVQQQMLCAEARVASFAILGGFRRRYHVDDIPANPDFQAILVETIDRFMLAVQAGSWDRWEGEIEGSKATTEALRRLYPRDSGTTVSLSSDACLWADELAAAKLEISQAEQREAAAKNKLLAAIGESTFAQLPDGRKFSLKLQKRAAHVVKESEFRVLRSVK
jgi:putative phage-type endonuclease